MTNIQFNYALNDYVDIRNDRGEGWHRAVVVKLEPYRGRPGYYVTNLPIRPLSEGSSGGWVYEAVMRRAKD